VTGEATCAQACPGAARIFQEQKAMADRRKPTGLYPAVGVLVAISALAARPAWADPGSTSNAEYLHVDVDAPTFFILRLQQSDPCITQIQMVEISNGSVNVHSNPTAMGVVRVDVSTPSYQVNSGFVNVCDGSGFGGEASGTSFTGRFQLQGGAQSVAQCFREIDAGDLSTGAMATSTDCPSGTWIQSSAQRASVKDSLTDSNGNTLSVDVSVRTVDNVPPALDSTAVLKNTSLMLKGTGKPELIRLGENIDLYVSAAYSVRTAEIERASLTLNGVDHWDSAPFTADASIAFAFDFTDDVKPHLGTVFDPAAEDAFGQWAQSVASAVADLTGGLIPIPFP
jgi:hypothetical protein